jgi:hypothetical protein
MSCRIFELEGSGNPSSPKYVGRKSLRLMATTVGNYFVQRISSSTALIRIVLAYCNFGVAIVPYADGKSFFHVGEGSERRL